MRLTLGMAALSVLVAGAATGGEIAPKDVVHDDYGAVETSLTGVPGDPANGAAVVSSRAKGNCVACHASTALADVPFHGEVGPMLDGAGSRWSEAELRGLIVNAKMTFDGTIMPAFYKTSGYIRPGNAFTGKAPETPELPPLLTAQEVEDVVAFLMTLKDE